MDTAGGSKTVLPLPVPIFVPAPTAMFSAPTPFPLPMPLPIPVPCFVPTTRNSIAAIMKQLKVVRLCFPNFFTGCTYSIKQWSVTVGPFFVTLALLWLMYRESVDITVDENSSVFSLILLRWLLPARACGQ